MIPITEHTKVTLNFALRINETEEIDSTFDKQPVTFEMGDGSLLESFEKVLYGLEAGDHEIFRLTAEEAFGSYNEDNIQRKPVADFENLDLSIGLVIQFSDPALGEVPGVIIDYEQDYVTVDFNHPLAGRELMFEVEIIDVELITSSTRGVH